MPHSDDFAYSRGASSSSSSSYAPAEAAPQKKMTWKQRLKLHFPEHYKAPEPGTTVRTQWRSLYTGCARRFIQQASHAETTFADGTTPLHLAVELKCITTINRLLKILPLYSVNQQDIAGRSPLFIAAELGYACIVERLLQCEDIFPEEATKQGETPLFIAASRGHVTVLRHLLPRYDAESINRATNTGRTPLRAAAEEGHTAIIKLLMSHGASDGASVLKQHVARQNTMIIDAFFAAGFYVPPPHSAAVPEWLKAELFLRTQKNSQPIVPHIPMPIGYTPTGRWYIAQAIKGDSDALLELRKYDPEALATWMKNAPPRNQYDCFRLILQLVFVRLCCEKRQAIAVKISTEPDAEALYRLDKNLLDRLLCLHGEKTLTEWAEALAEAPEARALRVRFHQLQRAIYSRIAERQLTGSITLPRFFPVEKKQDSAHAPTPQYNFRASWDR